MIELLYFEFIFIILFFQNIFLIFKILFLGYFNHFNFVKNIIFILLILINIQLFIKIFIFLYYIIILL